jgi:hypothetical protein
VDAVVAGLEMTASGNIYIPADIQRKGVHRLVTPTYRRAE